MTTSPWPEERYGEYTDPMLSPFDLGIDFTEEEIAEYNSLHVIPFQKPDWQSTCQQVPHPEYPEVLINKCEHLDLNPPHPYRELALDELQELVHSDAVASLIMGERVEDRQSKLQWYLRASALSGKSGPILLLAERHFRGGAPRSYVDGEWVEAPDIQGTVVRFALEQIAQRMSDPRADPDKWSSDLSRYAGENAPLLIQTSNDMAN